MHNMFKTFAFFTVATLRCGVRGSRRSAGEAGAAQPGALSFMFYRYLSLL